MDSIHQWFETNQKRIKENQDKRLFVKQVAPNFGDENTGTTFTYQSDFSPWFTMQLKMHLKCFVYK